MEVIRKLVQNLIIIIILAVFLEMLLPAGVMKKYVKLVMGLLIIVVVVQAVGDLIHLDYKGELPSFTKKEEKLQLSDILEAGKKISGDQRQKAIEQYRSGLARQVMTLTSMNKEVAVVDVEVKVQSEESDQNFGQLKEIVLAVAREHEAAPREAKGVLVQEVEPMAVRVGRQKDEVGQPGGEVGPPREAMSNLINTVANFYNLKPEQVKVVYR